MKARRSGRFAIFAHVIMPDHLHIITDGARKPPCDWILERTRIQTSLEKVRDKRNARGHEYSLWDGHSNVLLVTSESVFMQRVNYIHQNPVRAELVAQAEDYRWSSARCRSRRILLC